MKAKIEEILETLTSATKNGDIAWQETDPASQKRAFQRTMRANGEDGTVFEIDVKYILLNEKWTLETDPSLWIKNPALPGGLYYVNGMSYPAVAVLRDETKAGFCSDMNPSIKDVENIMDSIMKNISTPTMRENRIDKFLGGN